MQAGHAVIYHGALAADAFLGVTDFLVRVESPSTLGNYSYEVWDAKLARNARPEFILQLCCYADLLTAVQGRYPEQITLLLSDGTPQSVSHRRLFLLLSPCESRVSRLDARLLT